MENVFHAILYHCPMSVVCWWYMMVQLLPFSKCVQQAPIQARGIDQKGIVQGQPSRSISIKILNSRTPECRRANNEASQQTRALAMGIIWQRSRAPDLQGVRSINTFIVSNPFTLKFHFQPSRQYAITFHEFVRRMFLN